MIQYKKFITELFNKPLPWKRVGLEYEFSVEDRNYVVLFEVVDMNDYELSFFYIDPKTKKKVEEVMDFGASVAVKVLATVLDITSHFISKTHPESITFSAKGKARTSVYHTMVKNNTPAEYSLDIVKFGDQTHFTLEKEPLGLKNRYGV